MHESRRSHHQPLGRGRLLSCGAPLTFIGLALSGCSSSQETARDEAITAVRAEAGALRTGLASEARGKSGAAQLKAVRAVLPAAPFTAAAHGEGVVVTGAVTERKEAGGGLSYEGYTVRLCLQYRIQASSGVTEVADVPCDPDAATKAPANETVRLTD